MKSTLLFAAVTLTIVACASEASADTIFNAKREGDTPEFLPTANLAIGLDYGPTRSNDVVYGSFLLGVSHYPLSQPWSPFYSVAVEMDLRTGRNDKGEAFTAPVFGPQLRGGISYFPDNNGFLSVFNAYGLLSYRAPSGFEGHVFRFGIGISSPGVGVMLLVNRLALPWMVEAVCDVTHDRLRPSVRFGFSY